MLYVYRTYGAYIIDADGRLRERLVGEQTAAGLQARLAYWRARE